MRRYPSAARLERVGGPTHLRQAAAPAKAKIQHDRHKAEAGVRLILLYLQNHLFDPELNVESLKRSCGVRSKDFSGLFRREVGATPAKYIQNLRIDTAERLLRDMTLRVSEIGRLVGYSSLGVFSRAFVRVKGLTPTEIRLRAAEAQDPGSSPSSDGKGRR